MPFANRMHRVVFRSDEGTGVGAIPWVLLPEHRYLAKFATELTVDNLRITGGIIPLAELRVLSFARS